MNNATRSRLLQFAAENKQEIFQRNTNLSDGQHLEVSDGNVLSIMTIDGDQTSQHLSIRVHCNVTNETKFQEWVLMNS